MSMWLGLPIIVLMLLYGWLVDGHECRQGTLRLHPESKIDEWYLKSAAGLPIGEGESHLAKE